MSFNSPAKQHRIERHLMRQRGAGVRTVSSNFGFAFGPSPAQTSSDATPTRDFEAPPAKRRKTILASEIVESEHTVEKAVTAPKSVKGVKSRRRLPVDDTEEKQHAKVAAADDSFLAVVETKKARATKVKTKETSTTAEEKSTEIVNVLLAGRGRPRRPATTATASRVAEALKQGDVPLDRSTQGAKPVQRRSGKRKNKVFQLQEAHVYKDNIKQEDGDAQDPNRPLPKKQAKGRKRKAAVLDTADEKDELAESVAPCGKCDITSTRYDVPEQAPALKLTRRTRAAKRPRTDESRTQNGEDFTVSERASKEHLAQQPSVQTITPPTPPRRTRKLCRQRQPLAEGDMNMTMTMRSSSPEKVAQEEPKPLNRPSSRPNGPSQGVAGLRWGTKLGTKRRKLNIQRDSGNDLTRPPAMLLQRELQDHPGLPDADESNQGLVPHASKPRYDSTYGSTDEIRSATTAVRCPDKLSKLAHMKSISAKKVSTQQTSTILAQQDGSGTDTNLRGNNTGTRKQSNVNKPSISPRITSRRCDAGDTRKGKRKDSAARLDGVEDEDEDVDWLFAPQPQARAPKSIVTNSKDVAASRKLKLPEMDLDDLLSNIATFAQAKAMPVPAVAQDGAISSREKRQRDSTKKAKV